MSNTVQELFESWLKEQKDSFSGVFSVSNSSGVIYTRAGGYRSKAEELPNTGETMFGIASGTKLFTGLAVCKLLDEKKLALEDKLCDLLSNDLGKTDKDITVYQLLTHTSGVGDYIDEEADDADEQLQNLYNKYPVQLWERLEYYMQMIIDLPPKFKPGERYGYSNSGYILLGLVIEAVSGVPYQQFVHDKIIAPCDLKRTGFYRADSLPANTALGYIQDEDTQTWRTNTFSLPIVGGSDGGLYTNAEDLDKLWRAIFSYEILSQEMTGAFLKSYITIDEDDDSEESYGLGVYIYNSGGKQAYFAVGGDSGVGFCTAYYPVTETVISCFSNTGWLRFYDLIDKLLSIF